MIILLMGVSGSGKSTIGTLLAQERDCRFVDADDFHSAANKAKMALGQPLNDADRLPWLQHLNAVIRRWVENAESGVLACSTLKQSYRDWITEGVPAAAVRFVWLDGARELIAQRLTSRQHEFMNASLLDSQLATLEPPKEALRILNDREPAAVVEEIVARLRA